MWRWIVKSPVPDQQPPASTERWTAVRAIWISTSRVPVAWWDHPSYRIILSFLSNELREGVFGPSAFRSLRQFFTDQARYEKRSSTTKGLLLGVCFVAEDPKEINTFGRSSKKQYRSYHSRSFRIVTSQDEAANRLKNEMTSRSMIFRVMNVIGC